MEKITNLQPIANRQKSYYGKAKIIESEKGFFLKSYDTQVCAMVPDPDTGELIFKRLWSGYSNTTKNHVNSFRAMFGLDPLSKKEWLAIPVDGGSDHLYKVHVNNGFTDYSGEALLTLEEAKKRVEELKAVNPYDRFIYYEPV